MTSSILAGPTSSYRAQRGPHLRAKTWRAEGLLRMFENVLEVGENPDELIVYASLGKAARNWDEARAIAAALMALDEEQTLVLASGAAVGLLGTGPSAPLVLSAVNNTVGRWATSDRFYERADAGQTMWGGLTAGAWQYIGRQGVLQGTYELFGTIARHHFGAAAGRESDALAGRWVLTSGMGGMGSSQPISAAMLGLSSLTVEVDPAKVHRLADAGALDLITTDLDEALDALAHAGDSASVVAVGLIGNAAEVYPALVSRGVVPDIVTDQTAAHDARYGYVPAGYTLDQWRAAQAEDPQRLERDARAAMATQVQAMLAFADAGSVVFENGNNLRVQAIEHLSEAASAQVNRIPGFMEAYLRPLFARGIGPFRWVCLSGSSQDQRVLDDLAIEMFGQRRREVARWIDVARTQIPPQGLPARSCWLGHGERSAFALAVNALVADHTLEAPVLFSRDHLDSASMTHPRIGTEGMRDGSDGVTDFPLLDAMALAATGADLVAVHSGGGGYAGWMQSAGVSIVADGRPETAVRLRRSLDADTGLGVLRHASAGYEEASASVTSGGETGNAPLIWLGGGSRPR
ncbi:urocanate hydratase [Propioniciclava flava]|uniref:Urocanate hydratase n=1 Tax=Propioniciclava flava TaxID=2072026 RepID=A0A4Q2EFC8_9ACTN|nr:urocanate hydratase [Propioniciclava flava]RXW31222.1 urocanate hydratase [Propioniciclava flava]